MPVADSNGTTIYYEVHGSGAPLVLVHGSGGNHAAWWQQVADLRDRHRVVTIDLRGFGNSQSDTETYEARDFPGDIIAVLEQEDLSDAVILGQSIGGTAVLRAAVTVPERVAGVVLSNSVGGLDDDGLTALVRADRAQAEKLAVLDRLMSRDYLQSQAALVHLFREMGTFNAATMQGIRVLGNDGPTPAEVIEAGVRVAFLAGERDAVLSPTTVAAAQALLPGSVLHVVPDAPHSMYWERPDVYDAAIEELVERLRAPAEPLSTSSDRAAAR